MFYARNLEEKKIFLKDFHLLFTPEVTFWTLLNRETLDSSIKIQPSSL